MRMLIVGAGALGGYYGAHLHRAGRDITFLVHLRRAEQIARDGLRIVSPNGDFAVPARTVLAGDIAAPFETVLVATKAYSLEQAMDDFAPAVGSTTVILPILNGMAHLDMLSARFGADHVLGGVGRVGATLDDEGRVLHVRNDSRLALEFGELSGGLSDRTRALAAFFDGVGFKADANAWILLDFTRADP